MLSESNTKRSGPASWDHFEGVRQLITAALFLSTLAAYQVFVPVPLFAAVPLTIAFILIVGRGPLLVGPISVAVFIGALWAVGYQGYLYLTGALNYVMPFRATTEYPLYIALRYFSIFVFLIAISISYNLCIRRGADGFARGIVAASWFVAITSAYIYIAQLGGWWEPPRSRIGTGGQDFTQQAVEFSYAFHRALGTFREPSHMAVWLVQCLPFLMIKKGAANYILIGLSLILVGLSGSLLALLCLVAVGVASIFASASARRGLGNYMIVFAIGGIGILVADHILGGRLSDTISNRIADMVYGGIAASNRDYIYYYITESRPPLFGYGLGNANIELSNYMGSDLLTSHLSLYVNILYSLGPIVLLGFILVLIFSYVQFFGSGAARTPLGQAAFSSSIALLVSYIAGNEEFGLLDGLVFGALAAASSISARMRRRAGTAGSVEFGWGDSPVAKSTLRTRPPRSRLFGH